LFALFYNYYLRYTLIKGGNTRLLAFKALYRETSDTKFAAIDCIVEAWEGELNRTQAVIAHLSKLIGSKAK
jgi:hypothetical protein